MELFDSLKQKISGLNKTIVFPEGEDVRIIGAASRLAADKLLQPVLLGNVDTIKATAADKGFDLSDLTLVDPTNVSADEKQKMLDALVERRKGKNTPEQASKMLEDPNYWGTMMVYLGEADGMVSGAAHPTGDTIRPALQIIKTKPGVKRISGYFVLLKDDKRYFFADSAINIDLDAEGIAEVAVESAQTAKLYDIDPKVALLSFSTKGSAKADVVTKMQEATKLAQAAAPDVPIDGELQFDAAVVPEVAASKAPGSPVAGQANVFIFPELDSGNIGYKIAQRLGGFEALGPLLQGLNKPVSDLSRGANEEDVYKVAIITAMQSVEL
ncbi:phosphate acetyltransferase [Secundilactobacillus similis]|uniref:Phosphate acetyltransferase n=1 Tax=Secundilactobacillus similis DSM 23365 = JCM 2765 TaxID=1423804 RepID=A0A0R2EVC1_9LACO|nr:phosphate acetyltransferase [Secundilactobacillus similis]KRN20336.1 phosphotransacetylase [Secundilactobacillus similis DSM 23365 = JCM 2765]